MLYIIYIVYSHLIYLRKLCITFFFNSHFEKKKYPPQSSERRNMRVKILSISDSEIQPFGKGKKAFEVFDINGFTRSFGTPPRGAFLVKFSSICQTKFFSFVSEHDFGVQILIIFRLGLVYLLDREF